MVCCLLLAAAHLQAETGTTLPGIVPHPASITAGKGTFRFTARTTFAVENEAQLRLVARFTERFTQAAGFTPQTGIKPGKGDVCLLTDTSLPDEAYRLEVTSKKITIHAAGEQGFFYALQSIRQMLPAAIEGGEADSGISWSIPAVTITDQPRFGYRGLMVDVARFFTPKDDLLRIIDCMSMLKLNKLHLHLVDDNGWRIEIKKYPLLTEVGSRRVERPGQKFPERRNARQGEPTVAKGFYTQDDIRHIVSYAAERHVEVIPEIEMPAHSNAALAAYPLLACPVVDKYIGVLPGLGGNHADIIYCAGNDSVFTFLQDIIDEVIALFPSRYIHLGGDEAWKTHWRECPLCQARIEKEGLKNEEALQGYFMARMAAYVQGKGREVMGWDELTNTTIPPDAIIFGWQGMGQAALKAARQGHRFVMTPARVTYLIRYQGPQWFEPWTYFGNNTMKDIYDYEPVAADWTPAMKSLLMGVQGSLWTEFCQSVKDVEYLIFPRLSALAETAWTQPERKEWSRYLQAMDNYNAHIERKGITYARSMYNIQHTVKPVNGTLQVQLECIRPDVEIRYTTDGTAPTARSARYVRPLTVSRPQTVKVATFADGKQQGKTLELPLLRNKATAKSITSQGGNNVNVLLNGVRGSDKYSDFEWASWAKNDSIAFTVDLKRQETLHRLTLGTITNYGMAAHKPACLQVWLSPDGKEFTKAAEKRFSTKEIFREGTFKEDITFELDGTARYVRIVALGAGACPATHVRPGQEARIYMDELIIE